MYLDYFALPPDVPIGLLEIRATETGITHVTFAEQQAAPIRGHALIDRCKAQLDDYFRGQRQIFDLPLTPSGTAFQQRVWQRLRAIPYGETCTYAAIASDIGSPASHRAVGAANGRNPLPILVPCHRVIGSDGQLTGYAGGLPRKRWLLHHERTNP